MEKLSETSAETMLKCIRWSALGQVSTVHTVQNIVVHTVGTVLGQGRGHVCDGPISRFDGSKGADKRESATIR